MKTLFKLLAAEVPMHCMRQGLSSQRREENALTHKHSHTAGSREASLSRGNEKEKTLKQACFQGYPESAECVQIPIGSRSSAIHNAYHTSLRPSSLFEPRHPSLKVVWKLWQTGCQQRTYAMLRDYVVHTGTSAQPRDAHQRRASAGGAAPRDAQTMDQAAACHHPVAPWRTARGIQSASRNSTSASSHETVGCV